MLYSIKTISTHTAQSEQKNLSKMVFFVIKKKVCKKAVDRNRVKRRARKAFADSIFSLTSENGTHKEYKDAVYAFFSSKNIIFFLERDMIQTLYADIVSTMTMDIIHSITRNKK